MLAECWAASLADTRVAKTVPEMAYQWAASMAQSKAVQMDVKSVEKTA